MRSPPRALRGIQPAMPFPPIVARAFASAFGGAEVRDRAARLAFPDAGHGYDVFGLNPDFVALGETIAGPVYSKYFRVESHGTENIPKSGPGVLAANHSGTLPFDAPDDVEATVRFHIEGTMPAPSSRKPGLSKTIDTTVLKLLTRDPTRRPPAEEAEALVEQLVWEAELG